MSPLTPKDIELLRQSRGAGLRIVLPATLFSFGVLHLIICLVGLHFTAQLGELGGNTFQDIWRQWTSGVALDGTYSGSMVKALERLSISVIQLGVALVFTILGFTSVIHNRRNQRLIDFIESTRSL